MLFFLSNLLGCATVATGLILWTVARAHKARYARPLGLRSVEALNVGTIVGLPAAIACYFLANRLLPTDLAGRAGWEVRFFFAGWITIALAALLRPQARRWYEALTCTTALYLAVPTVDILSRGRATITGDAVFLGFDATMLRTAAIFAFSAYRTAGHLIHSRPPIAQRAPSTS
ncbi:hypothetical protein [Methylobacterium sp. WL103]|uniref:hypothetical protein n=1 Tax=Methylobacterium sp. WL103 TaxID=2603891 RepID=UPI00164F843E|nr:hypothetical protein [Methylobacterium sp. WL103]